MTQDEMIDMARQSGMVKITTPLGIEINEWWKVELSDIEHFAKLVAEKERAPQRTWVGLTRTELIKCGVLPFGMSYELCQAIEAKLKEKNT